LISKTVPFVIVVIVITIAVRTTVVLTESCGWSGGRFLGWIRFPLLSSAAAVWALYEFPYSYLLLVPTGWTSVAVRRILLAVPVGVIFVFVLFAFVGVEEISAAASSVLTKIVKP
jgi:hypothetical protein